MIHRDLKLENILLVEEGKLDIKVTSPFSHFYNTYQIIDFGIAGVNIGVHTDTDNPGSLKYLPPEALKGQANAVGPKWDVWAMGCILFVMVCGVLPFNGNNKKEIRSSICKSKFRYPPEIEP